jgi:hypothetical protein
MALIWSSVGGVILFNSSWILMFWKRSLNYTCVIRPLQ